MSQSPILIRAASPTVADSRRRKVADRSAGRSHVVGVPPPPRAGQWSYDDASWQAKLPVAGPQACDHADEIQYGWIGTAKLMQTLQSEVVDLSVNP